MVRKELMFCFVTFLLGLHEGSSLICYSCSASVGHNAPCENITERLQDISHQECPYDNAVCAKYTISYTTDMLIYRSCRNLDVCFNLAKKYRSQLLDCQTCDDGDFCNSSSMKSQWFSLMKLSVFFIIFSILSSR